MVLRDRPDQTQITLLTESERIYSIFKMLIQRCHKPFDF